MFSGAIVFVAHVQQERYELRGSRPIRRGRGGEIPPRYCPAQVELFPNVCAVLINATR